MLNSTQETEAPRPAPGPTVEAPNPVLRRTPRERPSGAASHEPTLADLAWTLAERRWTIAAVAGAALVFAAAYLVVAPPVYESSVLIQVESRTKPVAAFEDLAQLFDANTPAEAEIRILQSRTLLDAVVDELGLDAEASPRMLPLVGAALARRHKGPGPAPARFGLTGFAWGGERIEVKRLAVSSGLREEALVLVALEGGRYRVKASDGTVLVEGEVGRPATGTDGDRSVELLVSDLTARPGTEFTLRRLRRLDVIEQLQKDLRVSENGRHTGLVEVTLAGPDPARVVTILEAASRTYLRQSLDRTSAEAAKMLQILDGQLPVLKSNLDKTEVALNRFRQRNGTLNLSLEAQGMLERIGEIDRSIAEAELAATELTKRHTSQYPDVSAPTDLAKQLRSQRAAMEARMRALPDLELEYTRLSRQTRVATELYTLVFNRAEELRIVKSGWIGNARVLEKAVEPYRPVSPKKGLVMTLAMLLGLVGGIAAALVRNTLDDGVRDPDEIEAAGLAVMATIPHSTAQRRLARRGRRGRLSVLSAAEPGDAAVEDLRGLRTSVQFALLRANNNIIAVGGLAPRAGKSLVSVNLAHLLAAADGRVLLVDGDLRRGILHRYFGVEAEPGLADVVGGASVLDAVRTTDTPNLDLLPAGRIPANPSELLAGAPFQQLLADLGRRYKFVVVDTPPLLSVTDSALVGRHAGVNLLVLRAGEHSIGEISSALRRLAQNGVTVRGAILNDVPQEMGRYGRSGRYRRYALSPRDRTVH